MRYVTTLLPCPARDDYTVFVDRPYVYANTESTPAERNIGMRCLDGQVALVMVGAQGLEDEYGQTPVHCRQARAVALDTGAPAPVLPVRITPTIHLTAPA